MQEFSKKETRSGKRKGYICLILAIFLIVLIIALIILGYFVSYVNDEWEPCDGLGRMLDDVPDALSLILPQWAGHIWFIIDCIFVLAMIIFIDKLFVKSRIYFNGVKNVDF